MKISDYQRLTLSALIKWKKLRIDHAHKIKEDMFDDPKHIFLASVLPRCETMTELAEASDKIGGVAYLKVMSKHVASMGAITPQEFNQWLEVLESNRKKKMLTKIVDVASEELENLSALAHVDEVINNLMEGLVDTYQTRTSRGFRTIESISDEFIEDMISLGQGVDKNRLSTGFETLDKALYGGLPTGLVLVAGTPGSGKTQLCLQIAANSAEEERNLVGSSGGKVQPGVVAFNSAEMTFKKLLERLAQCRTGIEIKVGISSKQVRRIRKAVSDLGSLPLVVDDSDMLDTKLVYNRLESLYSRYKRIKLIVSDYAELLTGEDTDGSREQQVARVFIRSKILTRRYDCPHLLVCQLSREPLKSASKVPDVSHIRYTGMAEQLGDLILLIYPPYHYVQKGAMDPRSTPVGMPATSGTSYIIIGKHKFGPTGYLPMGWKDEVTTWSDQPQSGVFHKISGDEVLDYLDS